MSNIEPCPYGDDPLRPLGWNERVEALLAEIGEPGTVPGRVTRTERTACVVASRTGSVTARAATLPAVGDWVSVQIDRAGDASVVGIAERWSQLARRDPDGMTQILAANVDLVIVTAPSDRLSPARVEREIAVAWESGATPVVAATKADLAEPVLLQTLRDRLFGVDVVPTSTVTREGIDEIRDLLRPDHTAVLLGPSGAGKSTLVNALLGEEVMATGSVREGDLRGRHTTTTRQLLAVPGGGVLIDTPGLRSLSMAGTGEGVELAFRDVTEAASGCRFRDCGHTGEPGCAVAAAIRAGKLPQERLDSYLKLQRDLDYEVRRDDPIARKDAVRVWKMRTKANRQRRPKR